MTQIPNIITLLNLFCGCCAIVFTANGSLEYAAYAVFVGAIFDFFDGLVARALNAFSELGKQLDSLADVVTFGVVPGYFMYTFFVQTTFCETGECWKAQYIPYYGFIITLMSAYRLAKFNIDTRQSDSFIGVPTPINALAIVSLIFIPVDTEVAKILFGNHYILVGITLLTSYLLVSEIPMLALKFKHYGLKGNEMRFVLILLSLIMIIMVGLSAISLILLLYILLSLLNTKLNAPKNEIQS